MATDLVLENLKILRNELRDFREANRQDMDDLKARMSSLETAMISVKREVNHGDEADARLQVLLDRLAKRIDVIERRLELNN